MRGATDVPDYSLRHVTFQSTLLMRGATTAAVFSSSATMHFNPRSSCEERQQQQGRIEITDLFQSTLLMRGATTGILPIIRSIKGFQSTLLMRGATRVGLLLLLAVLISIHAPHARSDTSYDAGLFTYLQISIHAPHARSDGVCQGRVRAVLMISIHAPHARSDGRGGIAPGAFRHFNPRSSCEERLQDAAMYSVSGQFQSTLLMRGATIS